MADTPKSPDAPGSRRRKREPATIDLTATEVRPAAAVAGASPKADESRPEPEPGPAGTKPAGFDVRPYVATVVAGLVGAAAVMLVVVAAWATGLWPVSSGDTSGLRTEIAVLQKQVRDLQSHPAAGAPSVDALRARLGKVEQDIANLPPGDKAVGERLSASDNAMKSLGIALTALNRRNDDAAATAKQALDHADATEKAVKDLQAIVQRSPAALPGDLEKLQQRVAALEQAAKATREDIVGGAAADQMARLALSGIALRNAVESGAPFAAELAQARSLGSDETLLAPLARFAVSGVPAKDVLVRKLGELMPALVKAANTAATPSGFFNRLQANAATLVRVRPVNAPPGDEPATVLARLEVDAAKADIDGALADLAQLPEAARKLAQGWVEQVKARQAAISAARRLAASATQALGR